jgi:hypothetical protein
MNITVSELRRVTNLVFDRLEAEGRGSIELTSDFYWDIAPEHLYDPAAPPPESSLTLGQLSSDWDEVRSIGTEHDPVPWHDLAHLSALLKYIAASKS